MGLLTVGTTAKRFFRVGLDLFRMLKVIFGSGHGCYKLGYDAVKLAGTGLLRAGVAKVARVAPIARVVRNVKCRR